MGSRSITTFSEFFVDNISLLFLNEKSVGSVLTSRETKALAYVRVKNKIDILSTKNSEKVVIDRDPISSC